MSSSDQKDTIEALFNAGSHFGYTRSKRHASMQKYIFTTKNATDIIDLEKSLPTLTSALEFIRALGSQKKKVLFVGGKPEIAPTVREAAAQLGMPYVAGRWLGGTLSNFPEIKKRMNRMKELLDAREDGSLAQKYTKKERLMIDREIARLEENFSGLVSMDSVPDALVVVDTLREDNAVKESRGLGIPVVGIANSDCDITLVSHPIVANDATKESVGHILSLITAAYEAGAQAQ